MNVVASRRADVETERRSRASDPSMRVLVALAACLVGCSCGGAPSHGATPPPSVVAPAAAYEVHEWGLVRAEQGDVMRFGAVAPPSQFEVIAVDKPVLYFHADDAMTLRSVRVDSAAGGTIVETWPALAAGGTVQWNDVALAPGACTESPLPNEHQVPCLGLPNGDQCETPGLGVVRTNDAACVTTAGTTERFLFYRGRSTTLTPPLVFARTQVAGHVRVTNEGDAPIPGMLVRLWSSSGTTRALAVAPPAPHASIDVDADFDRAAQASDESPSADDRRGLASSVEPGRNALRATMIGLGLTGPEADAFLAAWSDALFGRDGAVDHLSDAPPTDLLPAPTESFVYFLPEPATDGVARLTFDPPPRAVHRAIAVWARLPS